MTRPIVVLAHAGDEGAAAVARELMQRDDPASVVVVRPEALGMMRWSHRVDARGRAATALTMPSGMTIDSASTRALLNRIRLLPPAPRFARATPKDRDYAGLELQALVTSWLAGLGARVINPVGRHGYWPGPGGDRGWLALAQTCGLRVARSAVATSAALLAPPRAGELVRPRAPWPGGRSSPMPVDLAWEPRAGDVTRVLVAGDEALGSLPAGVRAEACRELSRRSGCPLLALLFATAGGDALFAGVDAWPPLDDPGDVAAVAGMLAASARRQAVPA